PTPAGTWRGWPFTKIVRCAWMWNSVCSDDWQPIPSTACPAVLAARPASGAAPGTGTPSDPAAPAAGTGWSVPRALNGARFSAADPPVLDAPVLDAPVLDAAALDAPVLDAAALDAAALDAAAL